MRALNPWRALAVSRGLGWATPGRGLVLQEAGARVPRIDGFNNHFQEPTMEATTSGINRTGATASPAGAQAMAEAVASLSPPTDIDMSGSEAFHVRYISEAEAIGSIPPPPSLKGVVKSGISRLKGGNPGIFMDKIGERIAFERAGTRLYEALITKYNALAERDGESLMPAEEALASQDDAEVEAVMGEDALQTLERIRSEELEHFQMLVQAMEQLGGDPTAQTPCADVTATASMGLVQVLTDPRTTLAQSLNAILTAELTDNAGWELLAQLAEEAGESELTGKFLGALSQEQEHLRVVKAWLATLVSERAGSLAV
jgi:rubrerythrin